MTDKLVLRDEPEKHFLGKHKSYDSSIGDLYFDNN